VEVCRSECRSTSVEFVCAVVCSGQAATESEYAVEGQDGGVEVTKGEPCTAGAVQPPQSSFIAKLEPQNINTSMASPQEDDVYIIIHVVCAETR
jgi:hypothetical protein